MAPEEKKRGRSVPNNSQRSKKRQKIEPTVPAAAIDGPPSDVKKIPVALDALPWNEVEMPEMFDDAEGFFGLEEVEGVEVVREGNVLKFVRVTSRMY
jgi:ATP-dependent RNA helicase DDX24/MAK5